MTQTLDLKTLLDKGIISSDKVLLNEISGTIFSVDTDKDNYGSEEDVTLTIAAPKDSEVELYFDQDGIKHYIKIPAGREYPMEYPLALPQDLHEGSYIVLASIYYQNLILKTHAMFTVIRDKLTNTTTVSQDITAVMTEEPLASSPDTIALPENAQQEILAAPSTEKNKDEIQGTSESIIPALQGKQEHALLTNQTNDSNISTVKPNTFIVESPPTEIQEPSPAKSDLPVALQTEVGKPVIWEKRVERESGTITNTSIITSATITDIKEITDDKEHPLDKNQVQVKTEESIKPLASFERESRGIVAKMKRAAGLEEKEVELLIEGDADGYVIVFETKAPEQKEQKPTENEKEWSKQITISSDPEYEGEYEYKDVLTRTKIKETPKDLIRLYWTINGERVDVTENPSINLTYIDNTGDGMIDALTWIVPHLSTQQFDVVIMIDPFASFLEPDINIRLLSPANMSYVIGTIPFTFEVKYNASYPSVRCNLTIDSVIALANIDATTQNSISYTDDIQDGTHTWYLRCAANNTHMENSETRQFIADLEDPVVGLITPNNTLSLSNWIGLNFTATDNHASILSCNYTLNNITSGLGNVVPGINKLINATNLANGTYTWSVTCGDEAQNANTSSTQTFLIDVNKNFTITTNKPEYDMKEQGYFIITAPYNSQVFLLITDPLGGTWTKTYANQDYPIVEALNSTHHPGTYMIEGGLTYNGATQTVKTSYDVNNDFHVSIVTTNNSVIGVNEKIEFSAVVRGGIGTKTYAWDFGDSSTSTAEKVVHPFTSDGYYVISLTVKDESDNIAVETKRIDVRYRYDLTLTVVDNSTGEPIKDARITIADDYGTTGDTGKASFQPLRGAHDIIIKANGYESFWGTINIASNEEIGVSLKKGADKPSLFAKGTVLSNYSNILQEALKNESFLEELKEEENKTQSPQVENAYQEELDIIDSSLKEAREAYGNTKTVIGALSIIENLDEARKRVSWAARDKGSLESIPEDQRPAKEKQIQEAIDIVMKTTIADITVQDSLEFPATTSAKDIESLTARYLSSMNASLREREELEFVKTIKNLQAILQAPTEAYKVELEYLSGETTTIFLIKREISTAKDMRGLVYYEFIPKELAQDAKEINFLSKHAIIDEDPVIEFDLSSSDIIAYTLPASESLSDVKKISPALFVIPENKKSSLSFISGYSVVSSFKKIENKGLALEIAIIIILLIIYAFLQFELHAKIYKLNPFEKIKEKLAGIMPLKGHVKTVKNLIAEGREYLEANKPDLADESYHKAMDIYNEKLSPNQKDRIFNELDMLYNTILNIRLTQQITKVEALVKEDKTDEAREGYTKIQEIYKQLSPAAKQQTHPLCERVYSQLLELMKKPSQ